MSSEQDRLVTRARPLFMYVMYVMILAAIPIGILGAFKPDAAKVIAETAGLWLKAMPESMWLFFGACYLGYTGARSYDKRKGVSQ